MKHLLPLSDDDMEWIVSCMDEVVDASDNLIAIGPHRDGVSADLSSLTNDWKIEATFNLAKHQITIEAQHEIIKSYVIKTIIPGIKDQEKAFHIAILHIAMLSLVE